MNLDQIANLSPDEVYVSYQFIKPGKCAYAVQFENQTYIHKAVIKPRTDRISLSNKLIEKRYVPKHYGVFDDVQFDPELATVQCFETDARQWELSHFFTKSPGELSLMNVYFSQEYLIIVSLYSELKIQLASVFSGRDLCRFFEGKISENDIPADYLD